MKTELVSVQVNIDDLAKLILIARIFYAENGAIDTELKELIEMLRMYYDTYRILDKYQFS